MNDCSKTRLLQHNVSVRVTTYREQQENKGYHLRATPIRFKKALYKGTPHMHNLSTEQPGTTPTLYASPTRLVPQAVHGQVSPLVTQKNIIQM